MKSITKEETQYIITNHGTVIYTLPDGGKICDDGRKITFTHTAKKIAADYATAKWGAKNLTPKQMDSIKKNHISRQDVGLLREREKQLLR